jgi:hypothetical protein
MTESSPRQTRNTLRAGAATPSSRSANEMKRDEGVASPANIRAEAARRRVGHEKRKEAQEYRSGFDHE